MPAKNPVNVESVPGFSYAIFTVFALTNSRMP